MNKKQVEKILLDQEIDFISNIKNSKEDSGTMISKEFKENLKEYQQEKNLSFEEYKKVVNKVKDIDLQDEIRDKVDTYIETINNENVAYNDNYYKERI